VLLIETENYAMTSALKAASNRRNAQRSTGPRTRTGKKIVRMNALHHGLTARTVVLPHESTSSYKRLKASLIASYAPASKGEKMLVEQIAAGYWRTIRARRLENAMFDNQIRTLKKRHEKDQTPDPRHDDEACAVILQVESPESMSNYFRYDGSIARDYYRAIAALERAQTARKRTEMALRKAPENAIQPVAAAAFKSVGFVS
jgi:hypothetical protein